MKVRELQRQIEDSLEAVRSTPNLPAELQGLRWLASDDYTPRVAIRKKSNNRRLRSDASAEYFRHQECEVVVQFDSYSNGGSEEFAPNLSAEKDFLQRTESEDLLEALDRAGESRDFVGLKWFRDHFLPAEGYSWANDRWHSGRLIREATNEKLLLTDQIPNPHSPYPTTTIRINRSHPHFRKQRAAPRPLPFKPIRIQGKPLSATVIEERR